MELIQYSPATPASYAVPIVLIPPWINKFYVFDLSEQTSFVRYFLDQGFTLFMISWKNPTQEMRHVTFDDYLFQGVLKAIDVARTICKVKQVHAAGYCIGGTALAALMAWLNRASGPKRPLPVIDWTLFSTLVDFAEPGDLGVLITSQTVEAMEDQMKKDGYLDKKYLSLAFRLLRSDSLIWRNFVFNYLYGGTPPKSDMLYWNSDGTRLPEAMCSFYLRELYLNNHLAKKDGVRLGGRPIDLGCIDQPLYAVGAQQDHISPWQSAFRTCALVKGPVKFVLSSEGHITGIVNPPADLSRKKYWVGEAEGVSDPDRWLSGQREQRGSWWADWAAWLSPRSSPMVKSPSPGSRKYPPLEKAPGSYVLEP
jgi:polyhydroxyalkanoate synthase